MNDTTLVPFKMVNPTIAVHKTATSTSELNDTLTIGAEHNSGEDTRGDA